MNDTLTRRIPRLEQALTPATRGPAFVLAPDRAAADREIAQLKSEFGERLPTTLFVMTLADREEHGQ